MKRLALPALLTGAVLAAAPLAPADDFFDRLESALTFSGGSGRARARLSGTLDLETYAVQLPAPGVIHADRERFLAPRFTAFLDAQIGPAIYGFAQARADRGFDPASGGGSRVRLDEWALRFTLSREGRLNVQLGQFATVVGNWSARHHSWVNPFVNAPMPYENLTGVWDRETPRASTNLLQWSHARPGLPSHLAEIEKFLRLPIVWGPSYAPGAAIAGELGRVRYAAEVKFAALSSRPQAWRHPREQRDHPTVSARIGYRPNPMWDLGLSASRGAYLRTIAEPTLPPGADRGDYRQTVLAHDIAFAWHHWQLWGEVFAARFAIPHIGDAETLAYYLEAKYKLTPQLFAAIRWNEQLFGRIPDRGRMTRWGLPAWRIDLAPSYRFTPHVQLKFQYTLQHGDSAAREFSRTLAAQMTVRF